MHDHAERSPDHRLPDIFAELLARNEQRRATPRMMWQEHTRRERSLQERYNRANAAEAAHIAIEEDGLGI